MKLKLEFELWLGPRERPFAAAADTPGKDVLALIAHKLSREAEAQTTGLEADNILAHLAGIDPEWTGDFLKSI